MNELTNTRHNFGIDPLLHIWGWEIPVYLFLGGIVAGMMVISGYFLLKRKHEFNCSCYRLPLISIIFLSAGMLALFLDLEHKLYVWRLYTTFEITSPMSWGAWILIFVYPVLIANILLKMPSSLEKFSLLKKWSEKINSFPNAVKIVSYGNLILGTSLGIYTGILLSSLGARPLWNTSILWLLFLVSGLSTAAALGHMVAGNEEEKEMLVKADNKLIGTEILVLFLMIISLLSSSKAHQEAAELLISGDYAPVFWIFVIIMGLMLPLLIQILSVKDKIKHTLAAPVLVIAGGLILRFVIVFAGQSSGY